MTVPGLEYYSVVDSEQWRFKLPQPHWHCDGRIITVTATQAAGPGGSAAAASAPRRHH